MLRRDPTTIRLTPEDIKEFTREQTYKIISHPSDISENKNAASDSESAPDGSFTSDRSVKERILGQGASHGQSTL